MTISARRASLVSGAIGACLIGLAIPALAHPAPGLPLPNPNTMRECTSRIDTNCKHSDRRALRFVYNDEFCVYYGFEHRARCESYWPFGRPVINPEKAPAPVLPTPSASAS